MAAVETLMLQPRSRLWTLFKTLMVMMMSCALCFLNHSFNLFVVLASYGGLHVFKTHILLALPWNTVLVVYASQGLDMYNLSFVMVQFYCVLSISYETFTFLVITCRISYDRTTLESFCGKCLVLMPQLCAFLAFLNMKKSCGIPLNWQVSQLHQFVVTMVSVYYVVRFQFWNS